MYTPDIEFEWNEEKNKSNLAKHKLSFEDAKLVFQGEAIAVVDNRYDYGEIRHTVFGDLRGRAVVITYTHRETRIRIISMRRANNREKKYYQKRLEKNRCNER